MIEFYSNCGLCKRKLTVGGICTLGMSKKVIHGFNHQASSPWPQTKIEKGENGFIWWRGFVTFNVVNILIVNMIVDQELIIDKPIFPLFSLVFFFLFSFSGLFVIFIKDNNNNNNWINGSIGRFYTYSTLQDVEEMNILLREDHIPADLKETKINHLLSTHNPAPLSPCKTKSKIEEGIEMSSKLEVVIFMGPLLFCLFWIFSVSNARKYFFKCRNEW